MSAPTAAPRSGRARTPGTGTSIAALAGLLALGACGGADPDEASGGAGDPSAADATEAFVMPRDTDILLAELSRDASGLPSIGRPTNLTRRPDYDNQPAFVPDGSGLWYTANDPQNGQADIWRWDFEPGSVARVTASAPESEYSATPLPDGSGISTIRVGADSTQRLWRFDADGSNAAVLLEDVAPVGYHAWADENTVIMFVLGDPPTLQRGDLRTGRAEILAEDIGRSILTIPDGSGVSYVENRADGASGIMRLPAGGGAAEEIAPGIDGGDFHAWTPDATLLMAAGGVVYAREAGADASWTPVGDFTDLGISISRLAVSPDGSQIAMVAEPAPLEVPIG